MNKTKFLTLVGATCMLAGGLAACNSKHYDVKITVYNWEDYIYEGTDDEGEKIGDSTIEAFEKYYEEKTGLAIKVNYLTFSTNEEMYTKISKGTTKADLCCPSDYMIQQMQSEGLLESFGYDYDKSSYGEELSNVNDYTSPYIKNLFKENKFSDFAVPYFWGTVGFTYNSKYITEDQVSSWEFLWNPGTDTTGKSLNKMITIKDSVRDTYFTAVLHVYKDEVADLHAKHNNGTYTDEQFNAKLSEIFNRCDDATLASVEAELKALKGRVTLEVDEGKNEMVTESIYANLAWSGDAVFAMDEAEASDVSLSYALPEEGSNVWFDGWCMPKGANVEAAKEFVNFLALPSVAAENMDYVGYTSPIAGQEIWDLCNDWYAAEDDADAEEVDEVDLSYFFEGTLDEGEDAVIAVYKEDRGRQFDAQFPSKEVITRCAIMKDFGAEANKKLYNMWGNVKASLA